MNSAVDVAGLVVHPCDTVSRYARQDVDVSVSRSTSILLLTALRKEALNDEWPQR